MKEKIKNLVIAYLFALLMHLLILGTVFLLTRIESLRVGLEQFAGSDVPRFEEIEHIFKNLLFIVTPITSILLGVFLYFFSEY